jgi:hypothetical protein
MLSRFAGAAFDPRRTLTLTAGQENSRRNIAY